MTSSSVESLASTSPEDPQSDQPIALEAMRVDVLRAPLEESLVTSFSKMTHRTMVIVTLTSSDGHSGTGESWVNFPGWAAAERVATLAEGVVPVLRSNPTCTPLDLYARLAGQLGPLGRQWGAPGPIAQAISGVDVAMWDLVGRRDEKPGAAAGRRVRDTIPVYASGLGPTGHREQVETALSNGHRAVKVKVGFGHDADIRAVQLVREIAGQDVAIYTDANQAWTIDEAAAVIPALHEVGVEWLEEPLRGDRLEDLEELHRRTDFALVTGENLYGMETFVRYVRSPAIAAIQPDVSKVGGLTPALAIAEEARSAGCAVFPHLFNGALAYAASLRLAAAAPAVEILEYDARENALRDPLIVGPPPIVNGSVRIPDGPGHGVTLDQELVEHYTVESHEFSLA
jgi:L-alanine-DL-glutamate epimerase-like enolase superfamily enzyme